MTLGFIIFILLMLLALFGWWLYLILRLGEQLQVTSLEQSLPTTFHTMIQWEAATISFLILIIALIIIGLYIKNLRKNRLLTSFLSTLTHELKTPLASVQLQAQVLQEKNNAALEDKLWQKLYRALQKLDKRINNALELTRIFKKAKLKIEKVLPLDILEELQKDYPEIEVHQHLSLEDFVYADKNALRVIVQNIFENQRLHNRSAQHRLFIDVKTEKKYLKIIFCDNGRAFWQENKKLKQPFVKDQNSSGSGLGLFIMDELMYMMKGKLKVYKTPRFTTELMFRKSK